MINLWLIYTPSSTTSLPAETVYFLNFQHSFPLNNNYLFYLALIPLTYSSSPTHATFHSLYLTLINLEDCYLTTSLFQMGQIFQLCKKLTTIIYVSPICWVSCHFCHWLVLIDFAVWAEVMLLISLSWLLPAAQFSQSGAKVDHIIEIV